MSNISSADWNWFLLAPRAGREGHSVGSEDRDQTWVWDPGPSIATNRYQSLLIHKPHQEDKQVQGYFQLLFLLQKSAIVIPVHSHYLGSTTFLSLDQIFLKMWVKYYMHFNLINSTGFFPESLWQ